MKRAFIGLAICLASSSALAGNPLLPLGGDGKQGSLPKAGAVDWYRLKLPTKGQAYAVFFRVNIEYPGGGSVRILDDKGKQVAAGVCDWDDSGCLATFRAPYAGLYRVAVRQTGGPTTYTLRAAKDCAADVKTTCRLTVGDQAKGNVFADRDDDWWAVPLKAGTAYDIVSKQALDPDGGPFATLTVRNSAGKILRYGYGTGRNEIAQNRIANFRPVVTGTYFVSYLGDFDAAGPYTLKASVR